MMDMVNNVCANFWQELIKNFASLSTVPPLSLYLASSISMALTVLKVFFNEILLILIEFISYSQRASLHVYVYSIIN